MNSAETPALAAGESFAQGVQREIAEELGVLDALAEELFPFRYEDAATVVQAMAYRLRHDGPFHLQAEEIVRGEFVLADELETMTRRERFCPDGLQVWAKYREWLATNT